MKSFNDLHNPFKNEMKGSIIITRKLHCSIVDMLTCHFCSMSCFKHGSKYEPYLCHPMWWDPRHNITLMFVPCHALGHAKKAKSHAIICSQMHVSSTSSSLEEKWETDGGGLWYWETIEKISLFNIRYKLTSTSFVLKRMQFSLSNELNTLNFGHIYKKYWHFYTNKYH